MFSLGTKLDTQIQFLSPEAILRSNGTNNNNYKIAKYYFKSAVQRIVLYLVLISVVEILKIKGL